MTYYDYDDDKMPFDEDEAEDTKTSN